MTYSFIAEPHAADPMHAAYQLFCFAAQLGSHTQEFAIGMIAHCLNGAKATTELCPPKPNELEIPAVMSCGCFSLGTVFRSATSSTRLSYKHKHTIGLSVFNSQIGQKAAGDARVEVFVPQKPNR